MSKINFQYNVQLDAWSWARFAKHKSLWRANSEIMTKHIPPDILKLLQESDGDVAKNIALEAVKRQNHEGMAEVIEKYIKDIKSKWTPFGKKFFEALEQVIQRKGLEDDFTAFLTTGRTCPYNLKEKWFMVSVLHSLEKSITTICHEIFHFHFLYYFGDYLRQKGLPNERIEDIKEAVTVLLNEKEFKDIITVEDKGYPAHQEMRKEITALWREERDFLLILGRLTKK